MRKAKQLGLSGGGHTRVPLRSAVGPTALNRTALAGSGQVQIQRPAIVQQTPQQQQQRKQGVISMEEVIADLRILEEQQVESERKLQQARLLKQRRLEQQKALESKLDQILYQNGQLRAELEHENDTLSKDQRGLLQARSVVGKAGDDLREFDRKLKKALDMKSIIMAHRRTQDRLLEEVCHVVDKKKLMEQQSHEAHKKALQTVVAAKQYEESIRQGIRDEAVVLQQNTTQLAKIRSRCAVLEENYDSTEILLKSLQLKENNSNALSAKEDDRFATILTTQKAKYEVDNAKIRQTGESMVRLQAVAAMGREKFHQVWVEVVSIQKEEGYKPGLLPSESNAPPVLELDLIRSRLQTVVAIVQDELTTKLRLTASAESRRRELAAFDAEMVTCVAELEELKARNTNSETGEAGRASAIGSLKATIEIVTKSIDESNIVLQGRRMKLDAERGALKDEIESANREIATSTIRRAALSHEIKRLDSSIADKNSFHKQFKTDTETKLDAKQSELSEALGRNNNLREELEQCVQISTNPTRDEQFHKAENTLADKLEKHPELVSVNFQYREDLSDQEQARIDLRDLLESLRRRTKLAEEKYARLKQMKKAGQGVKVEASEFARKEAKEAAFRRSNLETKAKRSIIDSEESAAKPRALLDSFMRVKDEKSLRGYQAGARGNKGSASKLPKSATDRVPKTRPQSTGENVATQRKAPHEKRVRWVGMSQNSVEQIEKPQRSASASSKTAAKSDKQTDRASRSQKDQSTFLSKSNGTNLDKCSRGATYEPNRSEYCLNLQGKESASRPITLAPKILSLAEIQIPSTSSMSGSVVAKSTSSRASRVTTKSTSSRSSKITTTKTSSRSTSNTATASLSSNRLNVPCGAKPSNRPLADQSSANINTAKTSFGSTSTSSTSDGVKMRNEGALSRTGFNNVADDVARSHKSRKVKHSQHSATASILSSRPGSSQSSAKQSNNSRSTSVSRSLTLDPVKKSSRTAAIKSSGSIGIQSKGSVSSEPHMPFHVSNRNANATKRASSEQASGISSQERDPKKRRRTTVSLGAVQPDRSGFDDDYAFDFSRTN